MASIARVARCATSSRLLVKPVSLQVSQSSLPAFSSAPQSFCRPLSTTRPVSAPPHAFRRTAQPEPEPEPVSLENDLEIPTIEHTMVHTIDEKTQKLLPAVHISTIAYNPAKEFIKLVSEDPPVVKVETLQSLIDLKEQRAAARRAQQELITADRELLVSFQCQDHDVALKVKKAKEWLMKGGKINIVFAMKSMSKKLLPKTEDEKNALENRKRAIIQQFDRGLDEFGYKVRPDDVRPRMTTCFWETRPAIRLARAKEAASIKHTTRLEHDQVKEKKRAVAREKMAATLEAKRIALEKIREAMIPPSQRR